ncbi:MAG TPA: S8 family serine peptidase, partial [Candidatus Lokiarchaeia archaeon]|nr:S8 family serine peptidase [Candidatus Lokiarchaeia archaeon]
MNRAIRMSNFQRVAAGLFLIALFMLSTFQALPFAGTQGSNNLSQDEQATNTLANNPLLPQPPQISSATGPVNVIVTFPSQVTPGELAAFNTAGGSLTKGPWNIGTYGFAGIINEENIAGFLQVVPTATVEQNLQVITSLNYATRLARAQNYTWDTLGLNGSSNGTIAILDTGINATHPAFAPGYTTPLDWSQTLVNWNDSTSSLSATPYDDNGHGTFIASVVASRGFNTIGPGGATVANFTANLTQQELFGENGLIGGWYEHKIMTVNVTEPNTNVTAQALFYEFSTPLQASQFQFEWKDSSSNLIQSANAFPAGTLCTLSSNVTTKVGTYDLYIRYNVPDASTFNFSVATQVSWHCAL